MPFEGAMPLRYSGAIAGAGLTGATAQYKFVKWSAENTVVLCSAITDVPCGVLQEPAYATGDPVDVVYGGETQIQAGAALAFGNQIGPNAAGQAQVAVSTQFTAGTVVNVAGATAAGNLVTAVIDCARKATVLP